MKNVLFASIITYLIFFWQLFLPTHGFWKSDVQYTYIPARYYLHEKIIVEKTFPFWTERIFLGFPIYADFENAYLNPINVISIIIFGPVISYKILHLLTYLLGSLCLFWWMKKKGFGFLSFIVANLIYFFNTFMINHQIHFNVVAGLYLFPTIIYLIDEIIEKFEIKKILLVSIAISYVALWGHAQTTFLVCFGGFVYFLLFAFKNLNEKKIIFFSALITLLVLIQILPQYIPSYNLYQNSLRESNFDYRQGSLIPRISSVIFVPYLFGKIDDYQASNAIYNDYTYTETYIYIGLSVFVIGLFGIFIAKKDRLFFTLYSYIIIFILVSFNANNPLFNENTPIINIFRYWHRSMVLFSFSFAILVAIFLEKFKDFVFGKKNFIYSMVLIAVPTTYLYLISYVPSNFFEKFRFEGLNRLKVITSLSNFNKIDDFEILIAIFSTVILIILITYFLKSKLKSNFLIGISKIFLSILILFDLYFFNQDVINFRIDKISKYDIPNLNEKYDNSRVIARVQNLEGMENIYPKAWSPFGYSQFREEEYIKSFFDAGLGNLKRSKSGYPKDNLNNLSNLGIKYILEKENEITLTDKKIELIKENIEGSYIKKNEGDLEINLLSEKEQKITLLIKHNNNWLVTLNNNVIDYTKEGIFMSINITKGENKISVKYIPNEFYLGLYLSILLTIPTVLLIKFKKRLINE